MPLPSPQVLVVEDEPSIRQGLLDVLAFRGYRVHAASDGREALRHLASQPFDLVVLDIMLPEMSGFVVCETLRRDGHELPVLMLTAKNQEEDVLRGFEAGADDYVTKPFSVRQLLARVQALLKRAGRLGTETFLIGPCEVSPEHGRLRSPEGDTGLTAKEVEILRMLADEPGRIISRRRLLREVWGMNNVNHLETRTVDVHIAKLRKKLGAAGMLVETVRGQGYRLCSSTQ
jgi:two-component system response regulator RegX3